MNVRYRELALADLEQIFHYLDERNPAGARKVLDAIRAAVGNIADRPLSAQNVGSGRPGEDRRPISIQDLLQCWS
jgi:plasmid stabilization system protein ParE